MILTCSRCQVNKPCEEFHNSKNTKTGHSYICIDCTKTAMAALRQRPAYNSYDNVKKRCNVPSHDAYPWYGAKGITYDKATFATYDIFWDTYGHLYEQALKDWPNHKLTIDRTDNTGHYVPGNIRFVPLYVNENNRSNNYYITMNGVTQSAAMWAREWGIPADVIIRRHKAGWNSQLIMHTPNNDGRLTKAITTQIKQIRKEQASLIRKHERAAAGLIATIKDLTSC